MEQYLARIGVSLPENLLERFDEIIMKRGYYSWMSEVEGERVGTISLVYDHNQRGLVSSLLEIEHEFSGMIR
jgi:CopG family nickel-responsive transcriptional regulator